MFKNILLLALIVFLLSVGLLFALSFDSFVQFLMEVSGSLQGILQSVGESGIVASVLMLTIELASRTAQKEAASALINNINQNLFRAVYKRNFSEGFISEIEDSIFKSNVFRRQHELSYIINTVDKRIDQEVDNEDHVLCEIHSKYELDNISGKDISHEIKTFIELPIDKKWHEKCLLTSLDVNGKDVTSDARVECTNERLIISYEVDIPASSSIKVSTKVEQIKRAVDSETWTSRIPSDGMRLEVVTPQDSIVAAASANHRANLTVVTDTTTMKSWKLDEFILPYQSVAFWWTKED